jgi:hypothetical protein
MKILCYNASTKWQCAGVLVTPGAWPENLNGKEVIQQMQNSTPTGFVYVIHAVGTNRIKIGYSADPEKRLAQLQTGSPYELKLLAQWPGTAEVEQRIHQRLAQYRCGGEWFSVPPFIGNVIYQAIQGRKRDKPSIWGKLWRLERNGNYYRWRLAFTPERCSRTGGKLTPEILRALQSRPGRGRHAESRENAELLGKRAAYLASLCRTEDMPGVRESDWVM